MKIKCFFLGHEVKKFKFMEVQNTIQCLIEMYEGRCKQCGAKVIKIEPVSTYLE